jgi:hypothetical protein
MVWPIYFKRIISALFLFDLLFRIGLLGGAPLRARAITLKVAQFPRGILYQFKVDGATALSEGGKTAEGIVTLSVSFSSNVATPLRLQVEVRPIGTLFTGSVTGSGGVIFLGKVGKVVVSGLADGNYHWQARLQNMLTGEVSAWEEFGAVGNVDFSIALREPLVVVPGILGTILEKSSDGSEVWPNFPTMFASLSDNYLDALMLNSYGNDAQSTIRRAVILKAVSLFPRDGAIFRADFYGNLLTAFTKEGYIENRNLFMAPYDWRLDIAKSVPVLAAKIREAVAVSPTGRVNIIAHSMGGLLLASYLAGFPSAAGLLDKVVLVGVPEFGAPYAFKVLNYGDDLDIPILNENEIKKIVANMPAVYELLPSRSYFNVVGGYIRDFRNGAHGILLDYTSTVRYLSPDSAGKNREMFLGLADNFHRAVDHALVSIPNLYNIVGCGKPTITKFEIHDGSVVDFVGGSGDGTVPEISARGFSDSAHTYFVLSGRTGINHRGLMSDSRPIALVKNIIGGDVGVALPPGISARAEDCVQ